MNIEAYVSQLAVANSRPRLALPCYAVYMASRLPNVEDSSRAKKSWMWAATQAGLAPFECLSLPDDLHMPMHVLNCMSWQATRQYTSLASRRCKEVIRHKKPREECHGDKSPRALVKGRSAICYDRQRLHLLRPGLPCQPGGGHGFGCCG